LLHLRSRDAAKSSFFRTSYKKGTTQMKFENLYRELLSEAAQRAVRYMEQIDDRPVFPSPQALNNLTRLGGPLPQEPENPHFILNLLDEVGSPGTVATTGGRYFGFVTGGALPATVAVHWLADAWDQNASCMPSRLWRRIWKKSPWIGSSICSDCLQLPQVRS
jgi:hypothetical protein